MLYLNPKKSNYLGWRVDVAEGDDWDVGIAGLSHGLLVSPWVRDDKEPGLPKGSLKKNMLKCRLALKPD